MCNGRKAKLPLGTDTDHANRRINVSNSKEQKISVAIE